MKKQLKNIYSFRKWIASCLAMTVLRLDIVARQFSQIVITLYQKTISPDKSILFRSWLGGRVCRHHPHCSQYGKECFDHYNFFTATYRTMDRISRCTPSLEKSYDPVRYRTVFASGSPIGVPFLQSLAADPRYDVVGVLTMPDMPSGRGMKMQENVIAVESGKLFFCHLERSEADPQGLTNGMQDLGLPKTIKDSSATVGMTKEEFVHKPHSLRLDSKKYTDEAKETYEWLQSLDIDIFYVVAYGYIIPQHILDIPKVAPINIHGSLLPAYRGASPLQKVFLDGLTETGITLMRMEAGLDSGPMIDKQIFKLGFSDTVADLIQRVKEHAPSWSLDSVDQYAHGELEEEVQDENMVTYCGKIVKEDGSIRSKVEGHKVEEDSLETIYRKYKAYYLWPKVYFQLQVKSGELKVITIDELVIDEELFKQYQHEGMFLDKQIPPTPTPRVLLSGHLSQGGLSLNPAIISLRVKPEGKKSMDWEDFKRGNL